jgi:hypothetical protein
MIQSRAWWALMRRNFIYRKRNWAGSVRLARGLFQIERRVYCFGSIVVIQFFELLVTHTHLYLVASDNSSSN